MRSLPPADLVIRGARVALPTEVRHADIAVTNGAVSAIGSEVRDGGQVIDARGLVILPGVVDAHVHFNEPGRAEWDRRRRGRRRSSS